MPNVGRHPVAHAMSHRRAVCRRLPSWLAPAAAGIMLAVRHRFLIMAMSSVPANARCVSDPVSWYRLILHPQDAALPAVATAKLAAVLADTGLIGESFRHQGQRIFSAGRALSGFGRVPRLFADDRVAASGRWRRATANGPLLPRPSTGVATGIQDCIWGISAPPRAVPIAGRRSRNGSNRCRCGWRNPWPPRGTVRPAAGTQRRRRSSGVMRRPYCDAASSWAASTRSKPCPPMNC